MIVFIFRRVVQLIPILLGMSVAVFLLVHFIPGDASMAILGENYSPEQAAIVRKELGLDRPLPVQFAAWLTSILRGQLGTSLFNHRPVDELLIPRAGVTFLLAVLASAFSLVIAIPLGILSSTNRDGALDNIVRVASMAGISMPVFWLGLLLMLLFSLYLGILPPGGSPRTYGFSAYVLPAMTLGLTNAALITRMTRAAMLEVLEQDYVRTARSKGVAQSAIHYRHALRNAIIPVVTVVGLQFGFLLSGTVVTEYVFSLPGLGSLLVDSVNRRDFPIVQGVVLLIGVTFVLTNLAVDVLYAVLDPRIRV